MQKNKKYPTQSQTKIKDCLVHTENPEDVLGHEKYTRKLALQRAVLYKILNAEREHRDANKSWIFSISNSNQSLTKK
ncbi:MAG: hypothetical protein CVU14_09155 [Bacteroidetes bacterium HGW-Bacteroidetes-9]|jgi:hypothetical protein|nr:MAG: hypothetical protein CVU14_09155 [Bacteroidetes bacterium HGW-Bacteroidetes-9]